MKRAAAAERAAHRLYACRLLQGREGETFEGVIDGVAAKGIYVRLLDPPVTVMVARTSRGNRLSLTSLINASPFARARRDDPRGSADGTP